MNISTVPSSQTECLLVFPGRLKSHFVEFCTLDSTYEFKTRQNATLTGQERQGDVQLKVC